MSIKLRIELEQHIAWAAIRQLLEAGFSLGVNDGEETVLRYCRDAKKVFAAMLSTDDDYLLVYDLASKKIGWIHFVYGNDGYDVMSDYTMNLEPYLTQANKLADKYN